MTPMSTQATRELATVQVRDLQVRSVDQEAREVTGIGVPFGQVIDLGWFREQFAPDCQFDDMDRALLLYLHQEPIGRLVRWEATPQGVLVTFRISTTARGEEVYTLLQDGVIDRFSIGFRAVEWLEDTDQDLITHTRVQVREFSLVPFPAYPAAVVTDVRHAQTPSTTPTTTEGTPPMTDTLTRAELDTILQTRDDDHRRELAAAIAAAQAPAPAAPVGHQWRSAGELLQALVREEPEALEFYRAFAGGTFADTATPATWVQDAIHLVAERRPILNSFSTAPLPAEGMTLEYLQLDQDTTVVAKQTAEGEPLPMGKVTLKSATAPVETFGGYTSIGLQTVKRSPATYVDTALTAMDLKYAKATESAVKAVLAAQVAAGIAGTNKLTVDSLSGADVFAWLDLVVDAAELADDRGYMVAGMKVSKDVFKALYRLADSHGDPLMSVTGQGVNRVGTLRASALSADLADIRVELVAGAAAQFATFWDSVAIQTYEEPGAPIRLQDSNIINLSEDFSKYGNLAVAVPHPSALIPVKFTAA